MSVRLAPDRSSALFTQNDIAALGDEFRQALLGPVRRSSRDEHLKLIGQIAGYIEDGTLSHEEGGYLLAWIIGFLLNQEFDDAVGSFVSATDSWLSRQ